MRARKLLVADLLCGAGGSSTGCARALAELGLAMELVCVNHWPVAIETHRRNHPEARHHVQDIATVRPHLIVPEGYLDVMHPAFRLGFLDAQAGRPVDHDRIADRIAQETPPSAFKRTGDAPIRYFLPKAFALAQYRYEEGRLLVVQEGMRCRAWGHPDFPPKAVRAYIRSRVPFEPPAAERAAAIEGFSVAQMRGAALPLLAGATA